MACVACAGQRSPCWTKTGEFFLLHKAVLVGYRRITCNTGAGGRYAQNPCCAGTVLRSERLPALIGETEAAATNWQCAPHLALANGLTALVARWSSESFALWLWYRAGTPLRY